MQLTDITIGPNVGFLAVLNLLGAAQGVLLALALLTTKAGRQTANRLMAALTLTIAIAVSGAVLLTSNYVFAFPHLSRLHQPFVFWRRLFVSLFANDGARAEVYEKDFLHFIPFVACLVYLLPYYFKIAPEDPDPRIRVSAAIFRIVVLHSDRRCLSLRCWCI
jgi:hypothetical protein